MSNVLSRVSSPSPSAPPTHSVALGYVTWILGFTGSHRFYFGRPVSGFIYLLTLGLLGIGWIVDLFLIPDMARKAEQKYATGPYDYSLAWIFQTYLGLFGIHRFYLGKWGTGILYALTGGLFSIGWFYDFATLNGQIDACNREARGL